MEEIESDWVFRRETPSPYEPPPGCHPEQDEQRESATKDLFCGMTEY